MIDSAFFFPTGEWSLGACSEFLFRMGGKPRRRNVCHTQAGVTTPAIIVVVKVLFFFSFSCRRYGTDVYPMTRIRMWPTPTQD